MYKQKQTKNKNPLQGVRVRSRADGAEGHLVNHSSSGTSMQANQIIIAISIDTGSHAMDSFHILSLLYWTLTTGFRHNAAVADLAVRRIRSGATHVKCRGTTLVLSISKRLTVVELLARAHTANNVLASNVNQAKIYVVQGVNFVSNRNTGVEAVHRE
jgi:hypothetical protein